MDCPQCGGTLGRYRLGGRSAVGCDDCGYVGLEADHTGEATEMESWDDALRRFFRSQSSAAAGSSSSDAED
jgi:hypothetical protein